MNTCRLERIPQLDEFWSRMLLSIVALLVASCTLGILIAVFVDRNLIAESDAVWLHDVRVALVALLVFSLAFLAATVQSTLTFMARRRARVYKN